MKKSITVPFFIPHRGCPHQCVFCNQHHISGSDKPFTSESIVSRVYDYTGKAERTVQIGFFGGTFTALPQDEQRNYLETALRLKREGHVNSIRLSTRPDTISDKICSFLSKFEIDTVELGIQSFDDQVLAASGRGHNAEDSIYALNLLKNYGFRTGIQLMPGLPRSSRESDIESAIQAAFFKPDDLRIYPTVVIDDTTLALMYQTGEYTPLTLEEAIERCAFIYGLFSPIKTDIIRIGLHPLGREESDTVLAGPYHTAFGFLVKARHRRNCMEKELSALKEKNSADLITAELPSQNYEEHIGHKRENISYLEEKYSVQLKYKRGTVLQFTESM
ncbi:MAG: radical SAM protein [Spirochaetes bacterium]|jgi:histone acetyltransferase (RNA polymerase elongator complex component)|nr:radical SAM protein [Spirochaetota bacterium]